MLTVKRCLDHLLITKICKAFQKGAHMQLHYFQGYVSTYMKTSTQKQISTELSKPCKCILLYYITTVPSNNAFKKCMPPHVMK